MITLKELAQELGVSETTISRVLNNKGDAYRISKATQERIFKAAEVHEFVPNAMARNLRLQRSETIGLMLPDIANPFFAKIGRSVQQEAALHEYHVIIYDTDDHLDLEIEGIQLMRQRSVDGLIVAPVGQEFEHLEKLYDAQSPLVMLDRVPAKTQIPYVVSDNVWGAKEAVRYFIKNGHKRIACIEGIQDSSPNELRKKGYFEALGEAGIEPNPDYISGNGYEEQNGYVETQRLLELDEPPTAIFAVSNMISLGVLKAMAEANLSVPEDMSLISFDDQPYSPYLASPMTTVAQDPQEMGRVAVEMLLNQIIKGKPSDSVCLPTSLIVRASVRSCHK